MRVKLDNIGKKYEGRENFTIRNIDLDIEDKDFCVILGPSGCGKSTLIRMIAGLNSITEGTLYFDDKIMNKVEPKDRDIAMVFQSYALYPHMTVYENMAFSLNMKNESKKLIDERVKNAAKILQLEDYLYNRPSDISGGQRQRVALGRAIVRNPAVFLMDEPLSNLDAKLRESMRVEIVRLHNQLNTTSIYVTHDQTEAMTMATKIVLLDKGIVQQVGAPTDFYRKPNNLFVAGFIGSPTMNIIEGKITDGIFVSNTGEIKIRPSDNDSKLIRNYEGKKVYLGIRSERFIAEKRDYNTLSASIDVIEMLGKEQLLYTKLNDGTNIVISQPGYFDYDIGEKHYFTLDPEALHFFDGESTERIN
ncbi:MAG: sn-glycerol-3-phosphate ABC transporter ATP-binding protein UgpC [Anaerococcus sp.]|uniref:sn-glycerol-3-phosphate ABC transporter ATP-binding protein UgpC n=3 Tax=Anaerococcus nagyae TaxID=1755241 RepID=A0A3E2TG01_9FIRM|nr:MULTISPECIES: sn-glycerol-3-phosphate ABC transporter ATP-binding protein UgpC [Anaerococcus]MDU2353106.1 sn-glycerol-3-phosphate ABC transporter ATP-binding protein UgpC [Anaerococcus sp.]MDU2566349.1 sn-glycerol-3-phosphate ABC transporter ATP-binding protein UgpC [Anaerococcus sp.]RGB74897.1 sn-glycerol-3-phosphate ABC transporter ATP-binding protein UgpC [Anaerococcus nagyae]